MRIAVTLLFVLANGFFEELHEKFTGVHLVRVVLLAVSQLNITREDFAKLMVTPVVELIQEVTHRNNDGVHRRIRWNQ